jgi:hypothetical protein
LIAAASVAAALLSQFWTQPELQLATRAESLLHSGQIEQALAMMSSRQRNDFPPQWEPPPRVGYGEQAPALLDVLEALTHTPAPEWVRQAYLSSYERVFLQSEDVEPNEWPHARKLVDALPEVKALHKKYADRMRSNDKRAKKSTR